jgi:hypothetical protein
MRPVVEIFTKDVLRTITPASVTSPDQLTYQQIAENTSWQTITLTYTSDHTQPIFYRVRANDGNASGTGTNYFDFYEYITYNQGMWLY